MSSIIVKPGGGYSSDDVTILREDVLKGQFALTKDSDDEIVEGTMELTGDITAADIRNGKSGYSTDPKKKIIGAMREQAGGIYLPGIENKVLVPANTFVTSDVVIAGEPNYLEENILRGRSMWGKMGTGVYAGDMPGFFLEPHNQYEELTGGWWIRGNEYSAKSTISYPEPGILRFNFELYVPKGFNGYVSYQTKNKILNKYRRFYFDYRAIVVTNGKPTNKTRVNYLTFSGFGASHRITIEDNITIEQGTIEFDISNTLGQEYQIGFGATADFVDWTQPQTFTGYFDILAVRYDEIG